MCRNDPMSTKAPTEFFDKRASESYDERAKRTGSINDNVHFLIRLILTDLSPEANILCVGVGTGTEILELAQAYPNWRFKGVDPSASMLDVCRDRLQKQGLLTRCELFHGYLSDFPETEEFDAVICLLVTHFIKDSEKRQELFNGIAKRLKPNGYLINSEIGYDMSSPHFPDLLEKWKAMQRCAGAAEEKVTNILKTLREDLSILAPSSTEDFLRKSGFSMPIQFFQSLLIRAWYSQKK